MHLNRRKFLRAAGVSLALPWLDSLVSARAAESGPPLRMVCMLDALGFNPQNFFPEKAGKDYKPSTYLEVLQEFRNDFTVMSGLSHPDVVGGHEASVSFLTAARHNASHEGFRNTISLEQFAAERVGGETRFPSLSLGEMHYGLSWTRSGVRVPTESYPSKVFAQLFLEGKPDEVQAQARRLHDGHSILDTVRDQAKKMQPVLGSRDREKIDEYFTSVRELEQNLARTQAWSKKPKPKVDMKPPKDIDNRADEIARNKLMLDLIHLALQTDSTRLIAFGVYSSGSEPPPIAGVSMGHHDLTHHGRDPNKLAQLKIVEMESIKCLHGFLAKLKQTKEAGVSLLDRTMVLYGSNLGNASSHDNRNLPILLAGGGFQHGQHLAFDPKNHPPLANVYVSMLQRLDIEVDKFGSSTGTLTGLKPA
jgi:hypothetical protein